MEPVEGANCFSCKTFGIQSPRTTLLASLLEEVTVKPPGTEAGKDGIEQQWQRLERKGRLFTQCWTLYSVLCLSTMSFTCGIGECDMN